jgi:SRSO17 transposase
MNFMATSKWDDLGMRVEYRREASGLLAHSDAMITVDGTDFPKKGHNSVGVARQYCGRLGKVDNCQASVMVGYAGLQGYALIDYELYMPDSWFDADHAQLRKKCGVPTSLEYRKKNAMANEMIREAASSGDFPAKYVGADSAFGSDSEFLDSLPEGLIYFADVKSNQMVFVGRPEVAIPPYTGKGRRPTEETPEFPPRTVKEIAEDTALSWNDVVLDIGAKGPIITNDKFLRVVEVRDGKPGNDVWLYIRKLADGKIKYALCNEVGDATAEDLRRPALMRWSIEQCFRECKKYLGMDHYESRSWDGWRRHMLLCYIAHLFVIKLRMEFGCDPQAPTSIAPYIDDPVTLDDYLKATVSMMRMEDIVHPNISLVPDHPQQILTIGLVQKLISASFVKFGLLLKEINYYLHASADAFNSHSKNTLRNAFEKNYGYIPDFG